MMPHDMQEHDDQSEDADMIKKVLQKIIDEMDGLEANRIHPKMEAGADVMTPHDEAAEPAAGEMNEPVAEEGEENSEGLDPDVLKELMEKAGSSDENGETSDDQMNDLHPDVAMAVRKKKGLLK